MTEERHLTLNLVHAAARIAELAHAAIDRPGNGARRREAIGELPKLWEAIVGAPED